MTGLRITTGKPAITLPPREAVTHRMAVIARTGMGKTYAAKNLAEEFVKARLPFVVVDPTGVWWGLRLAADGEAKGLSITILGGDFGDVPLEPTAGAEVADFVVDQPGHYVLDLSSFNSDADQDRFAEGFGLRLFRAKQPRNKRQPLMLFVDEADAFAPQQPFRGQEKMLGAYRALMRRGRVFGIGMIPITQRPAALNKNVLTQAEMLIVGQVTGSQDRKALDEWIREHATDEQRAEFLQSLAGLQKGEMWLWSPSWLQVFRRVRIRKAETFDSSKTPEPDEELPEPKPLTPKAKAVLEKRMTATIEKAKAEDPRQLQKRIRELEAELKKRPTETRTEQVEVVKEIPVLDPRQLQDLKRTVHGLEDLLVNHYKTTADGIGRQLHEIVIAFDGASKLTRERPNGRASARRVEGGGSSPSSRSDGSQRAAAVSGRPAPTRSERGGGPASPPSQEGDLAKPRQRILDALAWLNSVGVSAPAKVALAFLSGRKWGGGFRTDLGALRAAGLIDYPTSGTVVFTDAGRAQAAAPESPLDTAELQEAVYARIPKPLARILRELVAVYPNPLPKDELAERSGRQWGGGFRTDLGRLRSLALIDYPTSATAVALPVLFLEEAA